MASLSLRTWGLSWEASLEVMEAAMTGLETPAALPSAVLEGTKT